MEIVKKMQKQVNNLNNNDISKVGLFSINSLNAKQTKSYFASARWLRCICNGEKNHFHMHLPHDNSLWLPKALEENSVMETIWIRVFSDAFNAGAVLDTAGPGAKDL